ncbi:MAG: hypothetical protein IKP50_00400 [Bacilli bacterium]|nr:hypothetical protein [Bacilli bacterium]
MKYYIVWFTDIDMQEEYETYVIFQAKDLKDANEKAFKIAGDYVISVEPYNP